tara:strand:+ start:2120 stop:2329 length:210 start_codon:yes stop_codon:yes gene_type:complete
MKRILFRGLKQETKAQRHKRLQQEFLDNYNNYQKSKKGKKSKNKKIAHVPAVAGEEKLIIQKLRKMLGL